MTTVQGEGFPGGLTAKNPPANTGTQVRSLVQEDPICLRATKPMRHRYWSPAHAQSPCSKTRKTPRTTTKSSPHSPQLEKAHNENP